MLQIPTISPNDEVLVKDVDGAWKIYTSGQLIPLEPKPTPAPTLLRPDDRRDFGGQAPIARASVQSGKPVIADVRAPRPTTIGPVEELRMSVEDYLRSGGTAQARADGIRARVKLLGAQDYSKRFEGITAWKRSEVYSLYVVLGQESVLSGASIEETIAKRRAAGQPALSVEDVQAIAKLNNDLRN